MIDALKAPAIITVLFAALMTVVFLSAPTYAEQSSGLPDAGALQTAGDFRR